MANQPRSAIIEDGSTFHVTWRCHNKSWLLASDWAKEIYYNLLLKYKARYKIRIYSYCLMSSHPHLTGYCENRKLFSDYFRTVNSCFARNYNKKFGRLGQVVMDRFKSPRIQTDAALLNVMHYIDLNPRRANMVDHPHKYKWSSFHYYAYGKPDPLITPAPSYLGLALSMAKRQRVYLNMVKEILRYDWKQKKLYSSDTFIGDSDWVREQYRVLTDIRRIKVKAWRKRHQELIRTNDPPEQNPALT